MSEEEKSIEQPNSVKFSINASGKFSGECKVYAKTAEEAFETAVVTAEKVERYIKLKNGGTE